MDYRIVCTVQDRPTHHNHILGVGTGDTPGWPALSWSVAEVRQYILNGNRFYTISPSTGAVAYVERFDCGCGVKTIRSRPDAVYDNNLDNLPICNQF